MTTINVFITRALKAKKKRKKERKKKKRKTNLMLREDGKYKYGARRNFRETSTKGRQKNNENANMVLNKIRKI